MSASQSKQIRDRFLDQSRRHFCARPTKEVMDHRSDNQLNGLAACPSGISPRPGKSDD